MWERVFVTRANNLKLFGRKFLTDNPNLEFDGVPIRMSDNPSNRNPKEQLLGLNSGDIGDLAVTEFALDGLVVVNEAVELDVAGGLELDLEASIV